MVSLEECKIRIANLGHEATKSAERINARQLSFPIESCRSIALRALIIIASAYLIALVDAETLREQKRARELWVQARSNKGRLNLVKTPKRSKRAAGIPIF